MVQESKMDSSQLFWAVSTVCPRCGLYSPYFVGTVVDAVTAVVYLEFAHLPGFTQEQECSVFVQLPFWNERIAPQLLQ